MSGRKNVINNYVVLTGQSLGASFQSATIDVTYLDRVCFEIAATTSDAVGSITIQGSITGNVWVDLPLSAMTLSGANLNILIDLEATGLKLLRIAYTRTSGTGTIGASVSAKET
jgi:hypothetical protein